mgnify:CR=1 FL=1|tara:strand:- start:16129 stop:16359 length:231 start_codon:yes stop_codon:yes gene_type:complete
MKQSDLKQAYELSERLKALENNLLLMNIKELVDIRVEGMPCIPVNNDRLKVLLELEIEQLKSELVLIGVKEFSNET